MTQQSLTTRSRSVRAFALFVMAGLSWYVACRAADVREPWDPPSYWTLAYPASCLLSAAIGWSMGKNGWIAGFTVTMAQFPAMWTGREPDALWAVGLLLLCLLSVPAMALSALAGQAAVRVRRS